MLGFHVSGQRCFGGLRSRCSLQETCVCADPESGVFEEAADTNVA